MTDEDVRYVSPSRLGTYAACPRQYEFDSVWCVETPEETRRYLDRGIVLHATIETVCDFVREREGGTVASEIIRGQAQSYFDELWETKTERAEYYSDAHYRYDRQKALAAIEDYFGNDGPGVEHARHSVASEIQLSFTRRGVPLRGRVDNVVRTDHGLLVIDYKSSFGSIISKRSSDSVEAHLDEIEHHPGRVKSLIQAATYIEGLKEHALYEPGMDIAFEYYSLLAETTIEPNVDGVTVSVSGRSRDVTSIYQEKRDRVWDLIEQYYDGIVAERYDPQPWELIRENACDDCSYGRMCPDKVAEEVRIDE